LLVTFKWNSKPWNSSHKELCGLCHSSSLVYFSCTDFTEVNWGGNDEGLAMWGSVMCCVYTSLLICGRKYLSRMRTCLKGKQMRWV
jgi:hypothetical protein